MRLSQEEMNFKGTNVHVFKVKMEAMLRIKDCWTTIEEEVNDESLKGKDANWWSKDGKARVMNMWGSLVNSKLQKWYGMLLKIYLPPSLLKL